jgi:hypothetical protein
LRAFSRRSDVTKPLPDAVLLILFEVLQDRRHLPASDVVLSDVPREDRRKLQSCQFTRCQAVRAVGYFADAIRARLIEVTLGDVRCVEVDSPILAQLGLVHDGIDRDLRPFAYRSLAVGRGRRVREASNG